jgi:hypothetical protein
VQRRLLVLAIATFAILTAVAFAVRGHHSPTRDTFSTTTTAAGRGHSVTVPSTTPASQPLSRVVLCAGHHDPRPECARYNTQPTTG